jgi:hypothetical protein
MNLLAIESVWGNCFVSRAQRSVRDFVASSYRRWLPATILNS